VNTYESLGMHRQRGVTLVESLVALVVLSVGMLGIAGLYVESLRAGRSALLRTHAIALASDMADRIRANPEAKASYAKTATQKGTAHAKCNPGGAGQCSPQEMAANDIAVWHALVDDDDDNPAAGQVGLPGGVATISVVGADPSTYTIQIHWTESGQVQSNSAQTFALEIQI
jgi:type IV pilus assembly protein PilV